MLRLLIILLHLVLANVWAGDLPNPCVRQCDAGNCASDGAFLTPIYKVSNFTVRLSEMDTYPHFQLSDEANGYSMACSWVLDPNRRYDGGRPESSSALCDPRILQGYAAASTWYSEKTNSLTISQTWVCDASSGTYP
jgi:hypothetical protein